MKKLLYALLSIPIILLVVSASANMKTPARDISFDYSSFGATAADVQTAIQYLKDHTTASVNWGSIGGTITAQNWASITPYLKRDAINWSSLNSDVMKAGINWTDFNISGLAKFNGSSVPTTAVAGTDYVAPNSSITGATKTKLTYDSKGLITAGADATTADIADSTDRRYVTDAQRTVVQNTTGTNSGDQNLSTLALKSIAIGTTAPLTGNGTLAANMTLGITKATTSVDGYLAATDFVTFNNKQTALGYTPVPDSRTVNGHALTSNVTVTNGDLGAVPTTTTVNGHALSSNVTVTATDLSLGNVDNTSDANKPVSTATQTALDLKAPLANPNFSGNIGLGSSSPNYTVDIISPTIRSFRVIDTGVNNGLNSGRMTVGSRPGSAILAGSKVAEYIAMGQTGTSSDVEVSSMFSWAAGDYSTTSAPTSVSIDVTPSGSIIRGRKFTVSSEGLIGMGTYLPTSALAIIKEGSAPYLAISSTNAQSNDILLIESGGNVGIGTPSTTAKVEINGGVHTNGTIVSSNIASGATVTGANTGDQDLSGYVPTSRTVNGHALSSNVTVTATDLSLGNVTNTSDANKPVSTAQQTALDLKANLASPNFTGTVGIGTTLGTGGLSVMAGNVGIGTWNPVYSLEVKGGSLNATTLLQGGTAVLTNGGALGTPASGTLTNATGLPVSGITSSTSTALGVGSIELGHATDTTIARSGSGAITVESVAVLLSGGALGTPSSGTLTNATGLPEAGLSTTDLTTNDATTSKHGFVPKCDGNAAHYFDGNCGWTTPSGAGGSSQFKTVSGVGIGTTDPVGIGTYNASGMLEVVKVGSNAPLMLSSVVTGDGDYVIVTSTGNVGIGTTAPRSGFVIMNGNVGLGTVSPTAALSVVKNAGAPALMISSVPTGVGDYLIVTSTGATGINDTTPDGQFEVVKNANNPFLISSAGTADGDYLIVKSDGNVGIGTRSPAQTGLEVKGGGTYSGYIHNGVLMLYNGTSQTNNSGGALTLDVGVSGSSDSIVRVGPTYVNSSTIGLKIGYDGGNAIMKLFSESADLSIGASSASGATDRIRLTGAGNVGIGTSTPVGGLAVMSGNVGFGTWSPREALEINGNVRPSGYKSSDGTAGVTVTTCTGFKNGLCISGT